MKKKPAGSVTNQVAKMAVAKQNQLV